MKFAQLVLLGYVSAENLTRLDIGEESTQDIEEKVTGTDCPGGVCPYDDATCCSGSTCCPNGYSCGINSCDRIVDTIPF